MKRRIPVFTLLLGAFAASAPAADPSYYYVAAGIPCTVTSSGTFKEMKFSTLNATSGGYYDSGHAENGFTKLYFNPNDYSTLTAGDVDGYRFKGWHSKTNGWDGDLSNATVASATDRIGEDRVLRDTAIRQGAGGAGRNQIPVVFAKYVRIYEIGTSVEPAAAGTADGGGTFEEGGDVTLQATPKSGYSFRNWTKSGAVVSTDSTYVFTASASGTYVAVFTGNVYKVTLDQQGGLGGDETASVTFGEKAATPIVCPERFGWTFGGYFTEKNGKGTKVYNAGGMPADVWKTAGNLTLYASWTPNEYDLEIIPPAFGVREIKYRLGQSDEWITVTGETTAKVDCGTVCHVHATAQSGYDLKSPGSPWTAEDGIPGLWSAKMSGYGLVFAPEATWSGYRLTVNPNGGTYQRSSQPYTWPERLRPGEKALNDIGTVDGAGAFLGFFDGRGEPVYDASGLNVKGSYWTDDYPNGVFRGTGDLTVLARWGDPEHPSRVISVNTSDPSMGEVSGGGTYADGSRVELTARAKDGYAFLRWEKGGAPVSPSNPYVFAASEQTAGAYTAVFGKQAYTVRFYGNGGTNEMASQSFEYNEQRGLTSNKFERAGFAFAGWLTDPTNAAPTYFDGEIVSNLNVRLFASWTPKGVTPIEPTDYLDNAFSVAADCATNRADGAVALELQANQWCSVITNGLNQCVRLLSGDVDTADLSAIFASDGTLSYGCKLIAQSIKNEFFFVTNDVEIAAATADYDEAWHDFSFEIHAGTTVKWSFKTKIANGDSALIDNIRWIPDEQPAPPKPVEATTVGVTFRLNDGTPAPDDIYDNVTLGVGEKVGLPKPDGAGGFLGWRQTPDGEAVAEPWEVPDAEPVQLFAKWQYGVVAIPSAEIGLVYNGSVQTGVVEGVGYALTGNTATDAGSHSATATLASGDSVWDDGTREAKTIAWSIGKAAYDLDGIALTNAAYAFDGKPHSLEISGALPDGVQVFYKGNGRTEVGSYHVVATFSGGDGNHLPIEKELAAWLTITATNAPPVNPDPPPAAAPITNEVPVAVTGLVYDGTPKTGVPAGEGYGVVGNTATSAGTHVATAAPDEGHVWPDGSAGPTNITWSIAKGTPDVSGITFPSATYEYDGNERSFGIAGTLPPGVEVVYSGDPTNRTEIGTNTVTASVEVTDTNNWNAVSWTRTATLVITAKREPLDGTVANNYTAMLADGSTLIVSTKKQSVKGGVTTVTVTAKRIVGKKTYSYSGGKIVDGEWVLLPICKTAGMPQFEELVLTRDSLAGAFDSGLGISGNRLTQENFDAEFIDWQSNSVVRVGVAFAAQVGVSELCRPVKFSARNLPSGLKIDKTTGAITGVPTKAKEFQPRITATSTVSSKLKTFTDFEITVAPIDPWAVGTFNGGGEACQVKVTVSKTGKISGQLLTNGLKWKLSAKSFSDCSNGVYYATLTCKNGKTTCTNCMITVSESGLVGACDEVGGTFSALRNEWKDAEWKQIAKGFPKAAPLVLQPVGEGFDTNGTITLKFSSSGAVTAKGKFVKSYSSKTGKPSFYSASCSTVLCPATDHDPQTGAFTGDIVVYFPRKAKTPLENGDYIECVTVEWNGTAFQLKDRE